LTVSEVFRERASYNALTLPSRCWAISTPDFLKQYEGNASFSLLLRQYTQTVFDLMAQSTACNCIHSIEERCARWFLITHDRMDSNTFPLTQEFLATIIGVRRSFFNTGISKWNHVRESLIDVEFFL